PAQPLGILGLLLLLPRVMLLTMLLAGGLNTAIDRIAYKPLRNAPRLAPLITAVGISFALEALYAVWQGPSQINYPRYFPDINILSDWLGLDTFIIFSTKDLFLLA